MTEKKKFFVGKGKAVRRESAPQAREQTMRRPPASAASSPRRFLVGDGTRQQVHAPEPVTPLRYGVPVRVDGCTCARPQRTGHVPFCRYFADALYLCETADRETVISLARLARSTVGDLERRRNDWSDERECPETCPTDPKDPRRRCWRCPFWKRHADDPMGTPIQFAYEEVHTDDDLPF